MNTSLSESSAHLVVTTPFPNVSKNGSDIVVSETIDSIPLGDRPETYFVPILFFVIFVVGTLGNGTLVWIFMKHRTMRNVPNTYILSLAIADLLVIISSVPFTAVIYIVDHWPWGEMMCRISETAKDISVAVSIFTLTALSGDRFFAIVDPLKKFHTSGGGRKATRITLCIAVSIWGLAVLCATPAAIGSHIKDIYDEDLNINFSVCYPFPEHWLDGNYPRTVVLGKFLVLYVIPLAIIAIFYMNMANHLIISTRNVPGEAQGTQRQIKARKKVAITVLIFVVAFAICFLPFHMYLLFFYFYPNFNEVYNAFWNYFRIVAFCLFYLHSCSNPVALYWVSGAFRKHFNRYLLCIKTKRTRCNTCQTHHQTSMSMSTKRNQSMSCNKSPNYSMKKRPRNIENNQETSIILLPSGQDQACTKM
ncbi:neuropeptide CCHamide-1 receptor-like [Harmonia axyridis]|uniref:neuropeptide CCHamide-1 receptor-like n=1 Tax=Harmonia axyridis TaxID=115357 RepID=UPI001E27724D|nr:neuropeptide CCHamide-1 receptor-like [Harmonia axyridis]XP_045477762.1 neuropeptide CCHamide-1 receptor-like [Harmonia axyridis]XP_045477763.1 neuropeptide CCHamide-1 receptor-like [Harmonia axyridis]XP_045477764.1 neuropeptide CCHamide-1 receptor-like [Harmonia axyridis]XP_045477765.1 neuropeptide CCHamide-1 receptor-like [Harmonia axyridis]